MSTGNPERGTLKQVKKKERKKGEGKKPVNARKKAPIQSAKSRKKGRRRYNSGEKTRVELKENSSANNPRTA